MSLFNGRRILTVLAAVFFCVPGAIAAEAPSYTLALTWQPAFCASDSGTGKPECRTGLGDGLVLHGLWPNADRNGDGRLDDGDDYCLPAGDRTQAIALDKGRWTKLPAVNLTHDLQQRLARAMPGTASKLERHEWIKHGSCSGLGPERYFGAAVALTEAMAKTEFSDFISARINEDVERRDVLGAFAQEFGKGSERALQLLCERDDEGAYLSEIRLRLRMDAVESPLTGRSLNTGRVAKGSCPGRFRVVGDE